MNVTEFTKQALVARRFRREMRKLGYEELGEGGGRIWELIRGWRWQYQIVDCKICPGGKSVFVKCELPEGMTLKGPPV